MVDGLTDKTNGGISARARGSGSSYIEDAGGLLQVRPGMFSGSSSIFIGLSIIIVDARSLILPRSIRRCLPLFLILSSDGPGDGVFHISWNLVMCLSQGFGPSRWEVTLSFLMLLSSRRWFCGGKGVFSGESS